MKQRPRWLACLQLALLLISCDSSLRAGPALDTSTPIGFFTNAANLFLQTSGYNFTITNIPIYPTNYYTPALHRLLQLAANIYDASTNRAFEDGSSPNGPFYPSVFRPTFYSDGSNVFINGYVEDVSTNGGKNAYDSIPFNLPQDFASIPTNTNSAINIYGVPWVIGARKGFPNFNEFSMQSVSQITRKVQIVKPTPTSFPGTWQTNLQYTIGISNILGVEAWNSYTNNYSRSVDLIGVVNLGMNLTSELGQLAVIQYSTSTPSAMGWYFNIPANQWQGFVPGNNVPSNVNSASFQIPLLTNVIFVPDLVYQTNQPSYFTAATNFAMNSPGFLPHFVLAVTNSLRFIIVDHLTGRVIDYVQLNGMNYTRDLTGELPGPVGEAYGGNGGVWLTNLVFSGPGALLGVLNQIQISAGNGGVVDFNPSGWVTDSLSGNSQQNEITAFQNFLAGNSSNVSMQIPFTPTRKVSVYHTWQTNDPLVHYTLSDLTPSPTVQAAIVAFPAIYYWAPGSNTNYPVLPNISQVNNRYFPWNNLGNPLGVADTNYVNLAVKDPLVAFSDAWNFTNTQPLNFSLLGTVHRGTPWQTFYLKSVPVYESNWQTWTGDTNAQDALLSMPTNDWALAAALVPLLTPQDPHYLYGYNQTDPDVWAPAFEGMTVLTNSSSGLETLVIDDTVNSNAIAQIVSGINAERIYLPGLLYTNIAQFLAVPQLSVASPFLNTSGVNDSINDAAYESIPSQLLPLLRPDSIGSVVSSGNPAQFQFTAINGYAYNVQASTDLFNWITVATEFATNGVFLFADTNQPAFTQRFYRSALAP